MAYKNEYNNKAERLAIVLDIAKKTKKLQA